LIGESIFASGVDSRVKPANDEKGKTSHAELDSASIPQDQPPVEWVPIEPGMTILLVSGK